MNTIYQLTCSVNGKAYIGCTSRPISTRFNEHKYRALNSNRNIKLDNAIRKYGIETFSCDVIEECESREIMLKRERELIEINKTSTYGYNTSLGGESGSYGITGESHWAYGIKRTDAQNKHQSNVMKGRYDGKNNPFHGKSHSQKSKDKISQANRGCKPHTTKYWKVVLPSGDVVETMERVQFCKDNNLNYNSVRTATNQNRTYKNYKFEQLGE